MHKPKIIRCACRNCKQITNHEVLFRQETHSEDPDYWWNKDYLIVKCCGCNSIDHCDAITEEGNIEYDDENGEYTPTIYNILPPPLNIVEAVESFYLPSEVRGIYKETIDCINRGNLILGAAGCRATIEGICIEQNVGGFQLEAKINKLAQQGIITKKERDHLHAIRFMGNDSIHDIKAFDLEEVKIVVNILNHILENLYLIDEDFKKLNEKPITSYEEFRVVLKQKLDQHTSGEIGNLLEFTKNDRRIIKEDLAEFEKKLIDDINAGSFTRLKLSPSTKKDSKQRYEVC